jgi:CheY-like chemotaxis protein
MTDAQEQGQPFDVAILDMRMPPGINGLEAGQRIRELDPVLPIIFVSGYSDVTKEELMQRVPPPSKLHYYDKPLSFSQLVRDVMTIVWGVGPDI